MCKQVYYSIQVHYLSILVIVARCCQLAGPAITTPKTKYKVTWYTSSHAVATRLVTSFFLRLLYSENFNTATAQSTIMALYAIQRSLTTEVDNISDDSCDDDVRIRNAAYSSDDGKLLFSIHVSIDLPSAYNQPICFCRCRWL